MKTNKEVLLIEKIKMEATRRTKNEETKVEWYRVDNAATLFTFVTNKKITCTFRLSAELKQPINVQTLQKALNNIMPRFPYYNVNLRRGLFWNYWETNLQQPQINVEVKYPCQQIALGKKGTFPFRVKAYQKRIAVEFHHSVTDGTGALTFLKTLICEYLELKGHQIREANDIFKPTQTPEKEEYEDAFKKNFKKTVPDPSRIIQAFHMPIKMEPNGVYHIITGILPVNDVLAKAKKLNVTLTEYLAAVYLFALQEILFYFPEKKRKHMMKPIRLMVPVNLRKIYPSKTMRNFSLYVLPGIDPRLGKYTFEEIVNEVYHHMRVEVNDKFISQQIARNVRGQWHPIVRVIPLFIKRLFGIFIYNGKGENLYSGVITNLGKVELPTTINEEITDFQFIPAPTPKSKTSCAIVSHKDKLYINFGRLIEDASVEKLFFRKLVKEGLHVRIETN